MYLFSCIFSCTVVLYELTMFWVFRKIRFQILNAMLCRYTFEVWLHDYASSFLESHIFEEMIIFYQH